MGSIITPDAPASRSSPSSGRPSAWRSTSSSSAMPAPNRSVRAHSPPIDRGRDLDHVTRSPLDPQLGVHRTLDQADRRARARGHDLGARASASAGEPRRRDVDASPRSTGPRAGRACRTPRAPRARRRQQPFDRDLDAGHVLLDEQRAVADGTDAPGRRARRRRRRRRGSRPGSPTGRPASAPTVAGSRRATASRRPTTTNAGWGTSAAAERPPHGRLVAGRRHRLRAGCGGSPAARRRPPPPARPGRRPRPPRRRRGGRRAPRSGRRRPSGSSSGTTTARLRGALQAGPASRRSRRPPRPPAGWRPARSRGPGRWKWGAGGERAARSYHGGCDRRPDDLP